MELRLDDMLSHFHIINEPNNVADRQSYGNKPTT